MKISITEPCHENWDAMTPNQQGAFCHSCAKDVVDFSKKSLEEIKNFFSKPQSGKVCGRFEEKQLEELSVEDFVSRFTYWNFSKKFAAIFFLAFGLLLFSANDAQAQYSEHMLKGEVAVMPEKTPKKNTTVSPQHQEPERRMIKGKVSRRQTCSVETVTTEPTIKGNTVAEPVEEKQMMMGMIAFKPNKPEQPVVQKDTTVKGDTVITKTPVTEDKPLTDKQPDAIENIIMGKATIATTETPIKTETNNTGNKIEITEEPVTNNNEVKILLYPNPNAGHFTVEVPVKQTLTILDGNGKVVLIKEVEGSTNIDASHLRAGIYSVHVVNGESRVTKQVVITK